MGGNEEKGVFLVVIFPLSLNFKNLNWVRLINEAYNMSLEAMRKNKGKIRHALNHKTTIQKLRFNMGLVLSSRYLSMYCDFNALEYIAEVDSYCYDAYGRLRTKQNSNLLKYFKDLRKQFPELFEMMPSKSIKRVSKALRKKQDIATLHWRECPYGIIISIEESQAVKKEHSLHLHQSRHLYRMKNLEELGLQK